MVAVAHSSSITTLLFQPHFHRRRLLSTASASASASLDDSPTPLQSAAVGRRQLIALNAAVAALTLYPVGNKAFAADEALSAWEKVLLPIDPGVVLLDIAFVPEDPSYGFLLGTRQTILETKDGGNTWVSRSIPSAEDKDFNYRFNSISFKGKEGWIIGKPAILLHTSDAGDTWKRVPLSAQLPGDMLHHGGGRAIMKEGERPRFFDSKTKKMCWDKAEQVPGRDPGRWRRDAVGNIVCNGLHTCQGCLCFEYDHIVPFSRGGDSVLENCQILQTRINRLKSNKIGLDRTLLKSYSCDIKFYDEELDQIEMAVYGSVIHQGKNGHGGSIDMLIKKYILRNRINICNS